MIRGIAYTRGIAAALVAVALHVLFVSILLAEKHGWDVTDQEHPALVELVQQPGRAGSSGAVVSRHQLRVAVKLVRILEPSGITGTLRLSRELSELHIVESVHKGPIDWREMLQAVALSMTRANAHKPISFGLPRSSEFASPKLVQPWDGWDYASTHPIQEISQGGIAITINDHCALDLEPFPIFGCRVGGMEPKGDLFKDLNPQARNGANCWRGCRRMRMAGSNRGPQRHECTCKEYSGR